MVKKYTEIVEYKFFIFKDGEVVKGEFVDDFLSKFYNDDWLVTIDCSNYWTDDYIYFDRHEKNFESVFLKYGIIRLSPYHKLHNENKGEREYFRYWLGHGIKDLYKTYYDKE